MVFFKKNNLINLITIVLSVCLFLGVSFVFADLNLGDANSQIILQNNILGNSHQIINVSKLTIATTTTSTYSLNIEGDAYIEEDVYTSNLNTSSSQSGSTSAANVSAGEFGANTGGGNYSFPTTLKSGPDNNILFCYSAIIGSGNSTTSEVYSGVFSGIYNETAQAYSTILGGAGNKTEGFESSVLGGESNITSISATSSIIIGGHHSTTKAKNSLIVGGSYNTIFENGFDGGIIGGRNNSINQNYAVIIAGKSSTSSGSYSSIIGGENNLVSGNYSTIIGGKTNKIDSDLAIIINSQNTHLASEATNTAVILNFPDSEQTINNSNVFLINPSNSSSVKVGFGNRTDFWTPKVNMPTDRYALAIGVVSGKIYAIGGYNGSNYLSTNEEYDPSTDTWTTKANMPTARDSLAIGVVSGKIYAIGGYNSGATSTNEEYDPSTDTWTTKTSMPTARDGLAVGVVNNRIYAIGGEHLEGWGYVSISTNEEYDPSTDTWTTKANMPTARSRLAIGVVSGKIYAIGGGDSCCSIFSTNEEYDPSTDTWTTKANMPTARSRLAIGVVSGKIYAIGGYNNTVTSTNEEYDPSTNTWTKRNNMLRARRSLAIGVVNGRIYAIGGEDACSCPCSQSDNCEGYNNTEYTPPQAPINLKQTLSIGRGLRIANTSNNNQGTIKFSNNTFKGYTGSYWQTLNIPTGLIIKSSLEINDDQWEYIGKGFDRYPWTTKTSMPTARDGLAIGVVSGKIYAIGGYNGSNYLSTNEEYDPSTDTWTTKANMPTARDGLAVGVVNNRIYAIGGEHLEGWEYVSISTNEEYDPSTDTWTTKANMPTARSRLAIGVVSGKIYAIGGYNNTVTSTNEEYDPSTNTWTTKANMPTARSRLAIGVVSGKIYAIGGGDSCCSIFSTNEEYDPSTDTWTTKANMPTAKSCLAIGVVSGKIYAIGGTGGLTKNEEYDPSTDTWTTKANMPTGRWGLAIGVVDNKIYAIGGYDSGYLSVNEEYNPAFLGDFYLYKKK